MIHINSGKRSLLVTGRLLPIQRPRSGKIVYERDLTEKSELRRKTFTARVSVKYILVPECHEEASYDY